MSDQSEKERTDCSFAAKEKNMVMLFIVYPLVVIAVAFIAVWLVKAL